MIITCCGGDDADHRRARVGAVHHVAAVMRLGFGTGRDWQMRHCCAPAVTARGGVELLAD